MRREGGGVVRPGAAWRDAVVQELRWRARGARPRVFFIMSIVAAEAQAEPMTMNSVRDKFFTLHSKTKNDRLYTCNQCDKQMFGSARVIRDHVLGEGKDPCPCPDFEAVEMCKSIVLPSPKDRAAKKKAAAPAEAAEAPESPVVANADKKKKKKNNKKNKKAVRAGTVRVAATQMACSDNLDANLRRAEVLVREAAKQGAKIILLQELFHSLYFCQVCFFHITLSKSI